MIHAWLMSVALAAPPDELVRLWDINASSGGQVHRMTVTPSNDLLVGRTAGDLGGWYLDLDQWKLSTFDGCDISGIAPIEFEDGTTELWISCLDGSVMVKVYDGDTLTDLLGDDGLAVVYEGIDESLSDIFWDPITELIYPITVAGDENTTVHVVDPFDIDFNATDSAVLGLSDYPVALTRQGFNEAAIVNGTLILSHEGRDLSTLILGGGTFPTNVNTPFDCNDMVEHPFGGIFCLDTTLNQLTDFRPGFATPTPVPLGALPEPAAVCASLDLDDGWLAVTGGQVTVWEMDAYGGIVANEPYFVGEEDANNPIEDMVAGDGYLFGGGPGGRLHIVTARPWVDPDTVSISPTAGAKGEDVTVSFDVDEDADWAVHRGGDRTGSGPVLASGTASKDDTVSAAFVIDDGFIEGDNTIYVVATNDRGLTGHGVTEIAVDNPPEPPVLTDDNVAFGDGLLTLTIEGIADEDLASYTIYVSTSEWSASEFPTGGPEYDGSTSLNAPIVVTASPGARVERKIKPLENYVTHYIGVRATDTGGKAGPMSLIVKGTPRPTFTAAELAGDTGGTPCATGSMQPVGWLVGAAGLLALGRRRRTGVAAAVLAAALAVPVSSARAQEMEETPPWWRQDLTPAWGNFELRYGVVNLQDERIADVYRDSPTNVLLAEVGPQFFRFVELDFGFGFFQELAYTIDEDGLQSGDRTMLTWWPLGLDVTGRLHLLDEQPVVPTLRLGWDYVIWSEKSDNSTGGKDVVRGAKFGSHWGLGANILLDTFQPSRASLLEAQSGINDSWLTFEWRRQAVDDRNRPWASGQQTGALDFSGDVFTVGLKVDY